MASIQKEYRGVILVPIETEQGVIPVGVYEIVQDNESYDRTVDRVTLRLPDGTESPWLDFWEFDLEHSQMSEGGCVWSVYVGFTLDVFKENAEDDVEGIKEHLEALKPWYMSVEVFVHGGDYEVDGEEFCWVGFKTPYEAFKHARFADCSGKPINQQKGTLMMLEGLRNHYNY